jgi:hypothetical protein
MMSATHDRVEVIVRAAQGFGEFLGELRVDDLMRLVEIELGSLDEFVGRGGLLSKAIAPGTILHIVSGNSPHAGLQSLVRGVLLGSRNLVKVSKGAGAEIGAFAAALNGGIEVSEELQDGWLEEADALVVFGSDETVDHFRELVRPDQVFLAHGHKVSFAVVLDDCDKEEAALLAARDVSQFDQQGCLSPHCIYVEGDEQHQFALWLAQEMAVFDAHTPRRELSLGESGELMHLRSSYTFRQASDPRVKVWQSEGNTNWTVIYEEESQFAVSCLNRVVFVKPLPPRERLPEALAMVRDYLSTIALWPFSQGEAENWAGYGASRICPLGMAQEPSVFWHQDGGQVLAPFVTWVDAG